MEGNQLEEVTSLREKTSAFAQKIRTGMIQKDEAWQALHTTIMKTVEYPMPAINLSRRQWEYVMAPLLWSALPRAGIVRIPSLETFYMLHAPLLEWASCTPSTSNN
jgi:hypothetical protein